MNLADRKRLLRPVYLQKSLTKIFESISTDPRTSVEDKHIIKVVEAHAVLTEARRSIADARHAYRTLSPSELEEAEEVVEVLTSNPGLGPTLLTRILDGAEAEPGDRAPQAKDTARTAVPEPAPRPTFAETWSRVTDGTETPARASEVEPPAPPEGRPGPVRQEKEAVAPAQDPADGTAPTFADAYREMARQGPRRARHLDRGPDRVRGVLPLGRGELRPDEGRGEVRGVAPALSVRVPGEGPARAMAERQVASREDHAPGAGMDGGEPPGTPGVVANGPVERWGKTPAGDLPRAIQDKGQSFPEPRPFDEAMRALLDVPHDGSFTVDGDLDPTRSNVRVPSWWGKEPNPSQLRSWVGSGLPDGFRRHARFKGLTFRYSPSGKGYHLRGWAQVTGDLKFKEYVPLSAGQTFDLRRRLGDDPGRLFYDLERNDPTGWLADANRYRDAPPDGEARWRFLSAGRWSDPSDF